MHQLSAYQLIAKKRSSKSINSAEINWLIDGIISKKIPDYQTSAFLMATYLNGMTKKETAQLTEAMMKSGTVLHFDSQEVVDKHSTGGVGDKTSFILAPIAAACGVKVPMVAGRGLGHTGGTVDKIESIPNLKTEMSLENFKKQLMDSGIVLIGSTSEIAPADKIIYGLRDVTATIESIPLITASILSKKLAEGTNALVMDIKIGSGSFMKTRKRAEQLGRSIISVSKHFHRKCCALITDMSQPLGQYVGNSLEMVESINTLKGEGPEDLTHLSLELAAYMVLFAKKAKNIKEARKKCEEALYSGKALEKFKELIKLQSGDASFIDNPELFVVAPLKTEVLSKKSGYIKSFETQEIGLRLVDLKGGRKTKEDKLDLSVGFIFHKKIGDKVKKGESLVTIYHQKNQQGLADEMKEDFVKNLIKISNKKVNKPKLIVNILK